MNMGKALVNVLVVFFLLVVFSLVGAIKSPGLPSAGSTIDTYAVDFVLLLLPVVLLSLIAFFLGSGIRGVKNRFQSLGLAYVSAFIIGGVLALFTLFNFPYSAQVNLAWLGTAWYAPWLTIFIIGAPIILAFIV
jgi:hypothetical protein